MLDICLLGTGGSMPIPKRWLTSLLVRYKGKMILIDCGEGNQITLKMLGWGFKNIDVICLTHYHADHVAGLPGLLLTIGNSDRTEPLTIIGPPGIRKIIEGIMVIAPEIPYELNIREMSFSEISDISFGDMHISSLPVDHTIPCLSYSISIDRKRKFSAERAKEQKIPVSLWSRLQNGEEVVFENKTYTPNMVLGEERRGLKLCYATDTRPTSSLLDFIKTSDLFVCEGMYGDDVFLEKALKNKHMLFSEAATLSKNANVAELWLTHYSPSLDNPNEYIQNTQDIFKNTVAGSDLMTKQLHFHED